MSPPDRFSVRLAIVFTAVVVFLVVAFDFLYTTEARGATVTDGTVADWRMEEATDATVMVDSAGDHDGKIGRRVTLTGHAYLFPGETPETAGPAGAYQPGRLVQVPESDSLDPGDGAFAVTVRFLMPEVETHAPNLIQKGQDNQPVGYWKIAVNDGWPRCHFRDADDTAAVGFLNGLEEYRVDDQEWHTVTCERLDDGRTRITLDGTVRTSHSTTQTINNARPLVMGGKLDCAADTTGCDYIEARVAWVTITH